tara:strand:+ start:2144 stop:2806 length:663 start_codon:yes stop_codon:yes gene_type:complete
MPIDEALEAYLASLDQAEDGFLNDIEALQDDGLSTEEILLFIAALDISTYFIEDLQLSKGIGAYMAASDTILDNLSFFGATTEAKLVALRNIQQTMVLNLSNNIASSIQVTLAQGIANNLSRNEIKELMKGIVGGTRPDAVITTMLATYEQSVVATMAENLPSNTLWEYIGPRDEKNRAVCKTYLNQGPITKNQITAIKPDGFIFRGGWRCRHQWGIVNG